MHEHMSLAGHTLFLAPHMAAEPCSAARWLLVTTQDAMTAGPPQTASAVFLQIAEGGVLPLLRKNFAQKNDIFIVNFGSWHRRSSGDWTDYYTALHNLGRYYQVTTSTMVSSQ
jgi:hypothetical protein